MNCDHIAALERWRVIIVAIDRDPRTQLLVEEEDLRNDALTSRPAGPENAMALLTMCGEHIKRCGQSISEDDFEIVCKASDAALIVMHGASE